MMPVTIEKQIEIAAKATTVWRYVGTEEGLRQWWGMDIALEEKQGGRCAERCQWQGRICSLRGQVTLYNPPYQLSLFLQNEDAGDVWPAWTTISLNLTESNGRTQVTLVHQAFGSLGVEAAIGQVDTSRPTVPTPHAIWNMRQPQNSLATGASAASHPTLANPYSRSRLESSWLAQQEACWSNRLQTLAQQVLLAQATHKE